MNQQEQINFRELKKELKEVEPLSKENLDIKSWASDLQLWIDLQQVNNPRKIFIACVVTSKGEPRQIIQELQGASNNDDEGSDDSDEDSDSEAEGEANHYPSLAQIVEALETFYGVKEDQNQLLRELRALKIRKNEKVKTFNKRYRSLYIKLNKSKRKQISVLDYADSLENNPEAWKRVSLKDDISLEKAFSVAEKVDRLTTRTNRTEGESSSSRTTFRSSTSYKPEVREARKQEKKGDVDDLVKKMRNLKIKACFFCREPGHVQYDCPKLRSIVEENKTKIYNEHLNH